MTSKLLKSISVQGLRAWYKDDSAVFLCRFLDRCPFTATNYEKVSEIYWVFRIFQYQFKGVVWYIWPSYYLKH